MANVKDIDFTTDEELLADILANNNPQEFNNIMMDKNNKFLVEELSHIRGNIVQWLNIKDKDVLEVNGTYGAISSIMSPVVSSLDVVVSTSAQREITSLRVKGNSNTHIYNEDFWDFDVDKRYDYIVIANPFFENVSDIEKAINKFSKMTKEGGKIFIACDNKYGLKYFSGSKEPNSRLHFEGIEGYTSYKGVRCFSKQEIESALSNASVLAAKWFYPYPDRILPLDIYSDKYLPKKGELINNLRSFGEDEYIPYDENKVWDNLIGDGLFQQFSNSYIVLLEV